MRQNCLTTLRVLLSLLFIGTGILKTFYFDEFVQSVGEFGILIDSTVPAFAVGVCLAEIFLGLGLMLRIRGSAGLLAILVLCFIAALSYGKYLGLDIDCGCFGPAFKVSLLTQIFVDAMILIGLILISWPLTRTQSVPIEPS